MRAPRSAGAALACVASPPPPTHAPRRREHRRPCAPRRCVDVLTDCRTRCKPRHACCSNGRPPGAEHCVALSSSARLIRRACGEDAVDVWLLDRLGKSCAADRRHLGGLLGCKSFNAGPQAGIRCVLKANQTATRGLGRDYCSQCTSKSVINHKVTGSATLWQVRISAQRLPAAERGTQLLLPDRVRIVRAPCAQWASPRC